MSIRNEVLEKADRIGFASCLVLSIMTLLSIFYIGGYKIAEAMYVPPEKVEEKDTFADEPTDILLEGNLETFSEDNGNEGKIERNRTDSEELVELSEPDKPGYSDDGNEVYEESEQFSILGNIQVDELGGQEEQYGEDDQSSVESVREDNSLVQSGSSEVGSYSADELRYLGEIYDDEIRYCWYSDQVLPGEGLSIPGRYVDDEGYVRDEDGNLCVASNRYSIGTQIEVPFGDGYAIVYDTYEDEEDNLIDVYTDW